MKTIIYILFSLFLFCTINLEAQSPIHIDTTSYCYFNGITKQAQIVYKYQITNNSKEDYLTWIALVPNESKTNIELVHDFFKSRKGDFSLITVRYEGLVSPDEYDVGFTFIKKILPGKTFSYIIVKTDKKSNLYEERIVLIKKKEVEQYLKSLKDLIDEKYLFKLSSIFLIEK